ncbi:AraC family transcriptional regulator [Opitutaceae bacterium TAV5]|nr:AraC family transcriptional regulator [Opitutaceae bacterium TAV5]
MLRYLGYGERRYGERPVLPMQRQVWEFQFILQGTCHPTTLAGGVRTEKPRLYISHPLSRHGWTDAPGTVSSILVLHFPTAPRELADLVSPRMALTVPLLPADVRRFRKLVPALLPLVQKPDALQDLRAQRLLLDLSLFALERAGSSAMPREEDDTRRIARSLAWFREHLTDSPSVEQAAQAVGCSASHLRRLYHRAGHPSPRSVLQRMRLEAAAECLTLDWPQKKVAGYLGFSEPSAFARAFTRHFGTPPGVWRHRAAITSDGKNRLQ